MGQQETRHQQGRTVDSIRAYILVSARSGHVTEVAEHLQTMYHVRDVHPVYGMYDILTEIECNDVHALDRHVTALGTVEGVTRTMTLIEGEGNAAAYSGRR